MSRGGPRWNENPAGSSIQVGLEMARERNKKISEKWNVIEMRNYTLVLDHERAKPEQERKYDERTFQVALHVGLQALGKTYGLTLRDPLGIPGIVGRMTDDDINFVEETVGVPLKISYN